MSATILIVDDDAQLRDLMERFLKGKGYSVNTSSDGWDAVREIVVNKPDLVVMDIQMPKMTGLGALDILRVTRLTEHIPIIITSAEGDKDTILKTVQLGADDFVVKPFSFEKLAERVLYHLFQLDVGGVRRIMLAVNAQMQSPAATEWPGLNFDKAKYRDWESFPVNFEERELCVLLKRGLTLPEAAFLPDEQLGLGVVILSRSRTSWKCVWPRANPTTYKKRHPKGAASSKTRK